MGYKIKKLREEARLTQEQLAEKAGVSRVTIALLESKEDHVSTTRTLVKIAGALGTTVDALFFTDSVQCG
ncbi:MAG: helix-turn-helix domain-containing protein [Clostridia bacterium]|nr:helix-turn-helix domain-containing protein [Clostridia bacterium]